MWKDWRVAPWLAALITFLGTALTASLGFYQWRKSERRQFRQVQISDEDQATKARQFEHAKGEPLRVRRAEVLTGLLDLLAEFEIVARMNRTADAEMNQRVENAYRYLIANRALLRERETGAAQAFIGAAVLINQALAEIGYIPDEYESMDTNGSSPMFAGAAPLYMRMMTNHAYLAEQLRRELGEASA
jgi:hypothetical protein